MLCLAPKLVKIFTHAIDNVFLVNHAVGVQNERYSVYQFAIWLFVITSNACLPVMLTIPQGARPRPGIARPKPRAQSWTWIGFIHGLDWIGSEVFFDKFAM